MFTNVLYDCFLGTCKTVFVDANNTIGMLVANHPLHGKCKNLDVIEGIKQCSGTCQSSTFFNSGNNTYKIFLRCFVATMMNLIHFLFLYRKLESSE